MPGTSPSRDGTLAVSNMRNVYTIGRGARNISIERLDAIYFKVVKCMDHREGSQEHPHREK